MKPGGSVRRVSDPFRVGRRLALDIDRFPARIENRRSVINRELERLERLAADPVSERETIIGETRRYAARTIRYLDDTEREAERLLARIRTEHGRADRKSERVERRLAEIRPHVSADRSAELERITERVAEMRDYPNALAERKRAMKSVIRIMNESRLLAERLTADLNDLLSPDLVDNPGSGTTGDRDGR